MMDTKNYLQDIHDIRDMMSRSTQFLSLSGLSGVMAGIYALVGAYIGNKMLEQHQAVSQNDYVTLESSTFYKMIGVALGVLILSVITALVLTYFKASKRNETIWNTSSRRLALNFLIPFITGGVFSLLLLKNGVYGLLSPVMLIFYGTACVNASKYTFRDVRYLGITVIVLGLLAVELTGFGLEFWALGFGACHIIYGAIMHFKYDRKQS